MQRVPWRTVLFLAPMLALLAITLGCPSTTPTTPSGGGGAGGGDEGKTPVKKGIQEVESKGWGNLKGKVTLDGPPPDAEIKDLNDKLKAAIEKNTDKSHCLSDKAPADDKEQQEWRISKDGAVQNVVVWLRPSEANYAFKVDMDNPTWKKEVVIDQPFCAFEPHAVTLFPTYYDFKSKGKKATGQRFIVKNSAPMPHNTAWSGGTKNPGSNETLPSKGEKEIALEPSYGEPVSISCKIHTWMNGNAWVFDHPYAAVTDKDGNYEIKHAPAGADVQVIAWHEKAGFINGADKKGEKIKLEEGKDTTKDFKVKAK
jgi:hypothetical protein